MAAGHRVSGAGTASLTVPSTALNWPAVGLYE